MIVWCPYVYIYMCVCVCDCVYVCEYKISSEQGSDLPRICSNGLLLESELTKIPVMLCSACYFLVSAILSYFPFLTTPTCTNINSLWASLKEKPLTISIS